MGVTQTACKAENVMSLYNARDLNNLMVGDWYRQFEHDKIKSYYNAYDVGKT